MLELVLEVDLHGCCRARGYIILIKNHCKMNLQVDNDCHKSSESDNDANPSENWKFTDETAHSEKHSVTCVTSNLFKANAINLTSNVPPT